MECYHGLHWLYVISGSIMLVMYVRLSVRLMRAGGELHNIAMVWYKPFDSADDYTKRMPYKHALSVAKNEHAMGTVAIKTVAVLAATFLGTVHPTVVATVRTELSICGSFLSQAHSHASCATDLGRVRRSWLLSVACCWG